MTTTAEKCPECGAAMPAKAPGGLCPRCLVAMNLAAETQAPTGAAGPGGTRVMSAPAEEPMPVEDVARLFPQLEILDCLGRGGMGAVYRARQPRLNRFVALKILTRGRGTDAAFAERFTREAQALARLSHPGIVAVHDFGEAGGHCFLLMEFVDGANLRQLLLDQKLSSAAALAIVPQICDALQYAHSQSVVHRDIKPENILLDTQGRVKIADFGIAKLLGTEAPARPLTGDKDVIGTPHYMAPEQIEKPQTVDHRADIYSLGVVFYEMLTGELPLGKFQPPSRKVQVDVRLDEVVLHALEKEPARRYQHASQVKTDVEMIAGSPRPQAAAESPGTKARAWSGLRRWFAPLVVVRNGERVIHWPGVWQDSFMLAGLYSVVWLVVVMVLAPLMGTPHVGALVGGILGFVPGMLALGFYRSFRRPLNRLEHLDGGSPKAEEDSKFAPVTSSWVTAARWTARVFSLLLLAFYGFFMLAEGLPPVFTQPEGVQLNFVALGFTLAGFLVGWRREGTAALLIASGWTLWQVSEDSVKWNLLQTPLPVAALYGFCWWAKTRKTVVVAGTVATMVLAFAVGRLFCPTNVFISGLVSSATTGQPIANVELRLAGNRSAERESGRYPNARTGNDGWFNLYVGWHAADRQMVISAPGYETVTTNLGPRPLGQRKVTKDIQLTPLTLPVPPVVISTTPESGTADVDPNLTELRVTFSKPMQDGNGSWTIGGEGDFPEMTGPPRYLADGRTCVLPVRLKPGKLYAAWLNRDSLKSFTDTAGQPALPYLLIFETRQ